MPIHAGTSPQVTNDTKKLSQLKSCLLVGAQAQDEPVIQTTPGYSYNEPEVTLPVRPVSTTQPPTTPPALYGAPARTGRRLKKRR